MKRLLAAFLFIFLTLSFAGAVQFAMVQPTVAAAPKKNAAAKKKADAKKKAAAKKKKKGLRFHKDWRTVADPMTVAAYDNDLRTLATLLKKKKNPNVKLNAKFGDAERLKGLVGGTPMLFAAWQGHDKVIMYLAKYKADVNATDIHKRTPLHWAAMNGRHKAVTALIKAGADLNAKDKDGKRPIDLTVDDKVEAMLKKAAA